MLLTRNILCVFFLLLSQITIAQSSNPVGSAYAFGDDCYAITADVDWELGAVWFNDAVDLNEYFEINLDVFLGINDPGADGVVFVFQQLGTDALGLPGGGLGFEGFDQALGIEMDTYQNGAFGDPSYDHMAIVSNGSVDHNSINNLDGPVQMSATSINVEDSENHNFKVIWNPIGQLLEVYFDCELRLSYSADIVEDIFDGESIVFWGFTGATGGESNVQSVCISEYALGLEEEYQVCSGAETLLGVVGGLDGSYNWSPSEFLDDPFSATPIAIVDETTEFTVTYTDLCGEETMLSTVLEVFEVEIDLPNSVSFCDGDSGLIEVIGNADSYSWSNGDTGVSTTVEEEGTASVTGFLEGCEATAQTEVVFYENPEFLEILDVYEGCEGDQITMNGTAENAVEYLWSEGETESEITVEENGTYSVIAYSENGCSIEAIATVDLTAFPTSNLQPSVESCEGELISLESGDADSWVWNTGQVTQSIVVYQNGIYEITLESNGCITQDSTEVIFYENPEFNWITNTEYCDGTNLWLTIPDQPYLWYWENSPAEDSVLVLGAGQFDLIAVDPTTGCSTVKSTSVSLLFKPTIDLPQFGVICDEGSLFIEAITNHPENGYWNDGSVNPTKEIIEAGVYSYYTENECGSNQASIEVSNELCSCNLFVPNAFSPDENGINEVFLPILSCDADYFNMIIVNRWGDVIFETSDQNEFWNGSGGATKGYFVPNDIYLWKISYGVNLNGSLETVMKNGTITIFR